MEVEERRGRKRLKIVDDIKRRGLENNNKGRGTEEEHLEKTVAFGDHSVGMNVTNQTVHVIFQCLSLPIAASITLFSLLCPFFVG